MLFRPTNTVRNFLRQSAQPAWKYGDKSPTFDLSLPRKTFDFATMGPKETYSLLTSSVVPRPIALVSSVSADGTRNLAPFSYFSIVQYLIVGHSPPLINISFSLSQKRPKNTRDNILDTRQFTVNIISEAFAAAANATSVEAPPPVDEWILAGLTPLSSKFVKPACVAESAVSLECEVGIFYSFPPRFHLVDHPAKLYFYKDLAHPDSEVTTSALMLGLVKYAHVHPSVLDPQGQSVMPDKLKAIARMGGNTYASITEGFELERPSWRTARPIYEQKKVEGGPPAMEPSEQREVRSLAVAKLKRAASLPRMKDGRRPPMHPEAMSEGERANTDDEHKDEVDTPSPEPPPPATVEEDVTITRPKRRSRSRTRSRGSKDLKAKARAALSPAPSPIIPSDSSQDEAPTTLTTLLMRSPTPTMPGTRPQTPNNPLPSLEDLQRGLFRSNSVGSSSASRIMAMHKLTGGQEAYDPTPPPATPPLPQKLGRNNTVSGGERTAVREFMLSQLKGRIAPKESEGEPPSGEEIPVPASSPSPTPRRRRRRSRRGSASANNAAPMSDSEPLSTSPNTPIVPHTPLPISTDLPIQTILSLSRAASPRQEPTPPPPVVPPGIPYPSSARASPAESERPRRRSVVVEDEEEERPAPVPLNNYHDFHNKDSSRRPTPDYPPRSSPFNIPLQEKQAREDDDEEEFLYPAESYNVDREISWVASPVPEIRMPIDDDDDRDEDQLVEEDEDEYDHRPPSSNEAYDDTSPRNSSSFQGKGVVIESETSPELVPAQVPPSPSSVTALSHGPSMVRTASDDSTSPQTYPARLSAASRSPLNIEFEWETDKRNWDSGSTSTWDKIKATIRSGSASGRRSRTNSIATRDRHNTDSSVSRESGASLTKGESISIVPPQSPSASGSVISLSPAVSPFPMATSVDMTKYQNAKLFPFPGMKKLEEQRNRAKGVLNPSASTPDISTLYSGYETDPAQTSATSYTPSQTPDLSRERKLSHQASDTRLLDRYASPPGSATPSSPANIEYFTIPPVSPTSSSGSKLPMTLPGVKQWLNSRKKSSQTASSSATPTSEIGRLSPASKKPSLSDLIMRKDSSLGLGKDWEDVDVTPSEGPTVRGMAVSPPPRIPPDVDNRLPLSKIMSFSEEQHSEPPSALPSPPDPLSPTPDLSSSLSDYPAPSTSESSSTTSSHYSVNNLNGSGPQGSFVLERLEENLARGSRSPMWASVIDEPPRKLVLSSEALQVVNANTVKDRNLFLFSDILVIAKPIVMDQDNIIESYNPHMTGRKYTERRYLVKNVVLMSQLRFNADRNDVPPKTTNYFVAPRTPLIRTFVHQFSKDPDHAITTLLSKSATPDDPLILGQVLFKTLDLDKARLGDYLSRRTSKVVLKAYVDSFRFVGVRVDRALRAFLLSVNIPARTPYNANPLDYLLDSFASRWYEANAKIVAFDKDLAIRLVRALVQLNDFLHGGIAQEPGPTGPSKRGISGRDFGNAFRQYDPRHLVPDELLDDIFSSIREERLSQARAPTVSGDAQIMLKRPLPPRLTYRVQSEPIVLRISQPDPNFTIQLFGQDLEFDPPVLTFARSSEASFRVTGQSLGAKTMIMCRSGPNAVRYSGLPLSSSLVIERAFMRNTFEIAFLNHNGVKRRYMFSMNDPVIRHEWVGALKRHIDSASSSISSASASHGTSRFHRATEIIAFKTLQQKLMGSQTTTGASPAAIRSALQRLNSNPSSPRPLNGGTFRFPDMEHPVNKPAYHVRSKSRSRLYHQQGPGQNEAELDEQEEPEPPSRHDGPVWSWEELQLQCRQNSSIPAVLAFLQVGHPEPGRI
ncbi:SEC7 domain-containing protein [Mycena indigotica]|uniref:SEC7 domain-containing protein n=1 Tax=Mycena indigotica TaxID=2126181 RepID=A0A8H6TF84_9AGAR|nr:SEC7 domain-containing protein [Mycena indigotica]KAF7315611.1 SEC7 domain-containing protein [Mycena indigotica]